MAESVSRRWNRPGIPHTGWHLSDVIDLFADALRAVGLTLEQASHGFEYEQGTCEMCGQCGIRYLHVMTHHEYQGTLVVGPTCSSKMIRPKDKTTDGRANRAAALQKSNAQAA